jgi:hypothetical protein
MRFSKTEVLEVFRRQEAAYRLAILASHWLRNTANFKPSVAQEARGLAMEVAGKWIPFSDLADELEIDPVPLASEFVLNQLHTSIRAPLEILTEYCHDYDEAAPGSNLVVRLKGAEWYVYARAIRNAVSHNFRFKFDDGFKKLLPTTWHGLTISMALDGKPMNWDTFGNKPGYELLLEMQNFAEMLPDEPSAARTAPTPEGA